MDYINNIISQQSHPASQSFPVLWEKRFSLEQQVASSYTSWIISHGELWLRSIWFAYLSIVINRLLLSIGLRAQKGVQPTWRSEQKYSYILAFTVEDVVCSRAKFILQFLAIFMVYFFSRQLIDNFIMTFTEIKYEKGWKILQKWTGK